MAAVTYRTGGPCIHRPPAGHAHPDPGRLRAAVRPGPPAGRTPACVTTATSWNVTPGPINHRIPPSVKDLAVPGHDRGLSRRHIPADADVPWPYQQRRSARPESDEAPPCMRWRGLARPGPARSASCLASLAPRAARRGQVPARADRSPGSSHVPGASPRWCPFPTVKALLLPPRTPRKGPRPAISCFPLFTKESTESRQLSAFHGGYPRVSSQPIHRLPGVSRKTPEPLSSYPIG